MKKSKTKQNQIRDKKIKSSKQNILFWIKSPRNIYLCILLVAFMLIGFINDSIVAVLFVIAFSICYGLILGLLYYFYDKE